MSERTQNFEFRDDFRTSLYPLADTATGKTLDGNLQIAPGGFVDAVLYPPGITSNLHIFSIEITTTTATITLADKRRRPIATGEVDLQTLPEIIYFYDTYDRPAGVIVASPTGLSQFTTWPIGTHAFAAKQTEFAASCVKVPITDGVTGFTVDGTLFSGDVYLLGDNGVVLTASGNTIRVDAVGDNLFLRKACGTETFVPPKFFLTINGCPPDEYGNFNITIGDDLALDTIVRLVHTEAGLEVRAIGA